MPSESTSAPTPFEALKRRAATISDLGNISAMLGWDQETYMPDGGAEARAEHLATISGLSHQMIVDDETDRLLSELEGERGAGLDPWQEAMVREFRREVDQSRKLSQEFVSELSRATSRAQNAWKKARAASDFGIYRDHLARIIDLKREQAALYGYEENPYDAHIDLFEPDMTVSQLRPVFERLKNGTERLLEKVQNAPDTVDDSLLFSGFEEEAQIDLSRRVVDKIGFRSEIGRIDLSTHPFCTSFSPNDVRLTTRVYRDDVRSCLFGLIHEAGHGMYEQGIDPAYDRTPLAGGVSMGIHESQSLFWENMIGRSLPFWHWLWPQAREHFPDRLSEIDLFSFYRIINSISPSFIRVEADELTYNLHIILRFEIENDLLNGRMEVDEIPGAWNDWTEEYLGIRPTTDAEGCLQDVHWSFGGFGYFPSYTLGKFYAAMFYNQLASEMPDLTGSIERGEFEPIRDWLREKIHRWGRCKRVPDLVRDVCGRDLEETDFLDYIERKIDLVYYGVGE